MGMQAMIFFCVMAWLPSILSTKTENDQTPGLLMLLLQIVSLISGFIAPILTQKLRSRLPIVIAASGLYLSGLMLVLTNHSLPGLIIGCILTGLASGTSFSYALVLIGLNGSTPQETAWLSGFSQMIGYIIASAGPVLLGTVFDKTKNWTVPVLILCVVSVIMFFVGTSAGKIHPESR
jgi:CP family cyanate transporter-like MFS transporter